MKVELTGAPIAPEFLIGYSARHCYDAKSDYESCVSRASSCKDKGHLSALRFASAVFEVSGISRVCSHQFVRSKHLDFLQRSQRYCDEREARFITPDSVAVSELNAEVQAHYQKSLELYEKLRSLGIKKEDARYVLPEATTTQLAVVGNFQAWVDFINLRNTKYAQWEIREVAKTIEEKLHGCAPGIF